MNASDSAQVTRDGVLSAVAAYLFWGFVPIYWKAVGQVAPSEMLVHRVIWSVLLLAVLLSFNRHWTEVFVALRNVRRLGILCLTSVLVSTNWLVFIWAVANDHIVETSLGYFITPLINVLLGMVFLRERLNRWQSAAVLLAAIGVAVPIIQLGTLPWISLTVGITFGLYGLLRKQVSVPSLPGLFIETLLLLPFASGYLWMLELNGEATFLQQGPGVDLLIMLAGVITTVPLLAMVYASKRLRYSTLGLFQYIAPTCQFLLGVMLYHEPFGSAQFAAFACIWIALLVFALDSTGWLPAKRARTT